ncbi:insecticidal delta-endotoxin Cry8Ea1 family protein [uncultured Aquimarina sp.]|uniref:insecticidal delta-endotoxin Cry8Ea1 family protein n=1 Tax=uncultured Aquimarina sp. TaxID=575652 RepID=UPI00261E047D|nr:insecticidal delta-endotoxin Cry8Ea1 family protein [uncultured Aquimarina sp.]
MSSKVHIVFNTINDTDNLEGYVNEKICKPLHFKTTTFSNIDDQIRALKIKEMTEAISSKRKASSEPKVATTENIPHGLAVQQKLKKKIDCFLQETEAILSLGMDEQIIPNGQTVSYLLEDWKNYKKGTPFVKRVTNKSTLYFFRPDLIIENGELKDISADDVEMPSDLINLSLLSGQAYGQDVDWTKGVKVLLDALMGTAPPPLNILGAALLTMVWPNGSDTDWEVVYDNIRKIIIEELDEKTLTDTYAELSGVLDYISSEYKHLAEDPKTPKETLQSKLEFYNHTLYTKILSIFQDERYANAALGNFLIAASTHIALFQERALQDPNHLTDPSNSPYAKTLSQKAKEYAAHVEAVIPKLVASRAKEIGGLKIKKDCIVSSIGDLICSYSYYYTDGKTGKQSKNIGREGGEKALEKKCKTKAEKHRKDYIKQVKDTTNKELQETAGEVAKKWRKLADNPIPVIKAM